MQELPDVPLFLSLHNLCATLKCTSPSAVIFRSAVLNAGYRISGTHVNPLGMKSDAPMDVIWDIMRCWVRTLFCSLYDKIAMLNIFQELSRSFLIGKSVLFYMHMNRLKMILVSCTLKSRVIFEVVKGSTSIIIRYYYVDKVVPLTKKCIKF